MLLRGMLPDSILKRMEQGETLISERFDSATILFAAICNFDKIVARLEPVQLVKLLNTAFLRFDQLTEKYGATYF